MTDFFDPEETFGSPGLETSKVSYDIKKQTPPFVKGSESHDAKLSAGEGTFRPEDYTVGWICALPIELAAASELLDEEHGGLPYDPSDDSIYTLGRIGQHNIVLVSLPAGQFGTNSAAAVTVKMKAKFPAIRVGLVVGVGGGVPSSADIRLGDVVVSQPDTGHGGVIQYDLGRATVAGFKRKGFLNAPPANLLTALNKLRADHLRHRSKVAKYLSAFDHLPQFQRANAGPDMLFVSTYTHVGGPSCALCNAGCLVARAPRKCPGVKIHYGTIASGNQIIRSGITRDQLSSELGNVLCFEMEAAGIMNIFPCVVIRGISDYADSHKNKSWQPYAAAAAAAYAKDLLSVIPPATNGMGQPSRDIPKIQEKDTRLGTGNIINLCQQAYRLYNMLHAGQRATSVVTELSDLLFGLHCSLNHFLNDPRALNSSINSNASDTSNVFRRPDILIPRCQILLDNLEELIGNPQGLDNPLNGDPVALNRVHHTPAERTHTKYEICKSALTQCDVAQIQAELQWCTTAIDILVEKSLRFDPSHPTGKGIDEDEFKTPAARLRSVMRPQQQKAQELISNQTAITPQPTPQSLNVQGIGSVFPRADPAQINYANLASTYLNNVATNRNPPYPSMFPNRIGPPNNFDGLFGNMEFSIPSSCRSPLVWISTLFSKLDAWELSPVSSAREKRARQKHILSMFMSLNSYIESTKNIEARRQIRELLEVNGLRKVIERIKNVVGSMVMLEKQIEVYNDDKEEDALVN
ncbi:5'-methylthioadenosine/S-adenosylhomocysteine nucleosidase family protein [Aspergillus tanneri]|uniref:Nucleoside phosphorylase domain-containing protein n=1 Tax=Aspergillus tanneri TaxID=1220188 RepID=A0A5M9MF80_9EURO|nr:uncharacterized protein ATNIH1004_008150 [Aspergillus tanneri]KAA8643954.1 hypothetical protein ATNIH1004_008150 [Aspergillus tanneri]